MALLYLNNLASRATRSVLDFLGIQNDWTQHGRFFGETLIATTPYSEYNRNASYNVSNLPIDPKQVSLKYDGSSRSSISWDPANEGLINAPFHYQANKPGKNFRRQLLLAFNVWLQVDEQTFDIINDVVGTLHNASLLIDDIEDGSDIRRGAPAAHCVYGVAQTINSANYTYFLAQQKLTRLLDWPRAVQIFDQELIDLHRGQGMDLYWRENSIAPTEEEYIQMVENKTGGLFRLAARLLQCMSKSTVDLVPLANALGVLFQIQDDYKNIASEQMTATKGFCEDLTEGKYSFPVIHSIRQGGSGSEKLQAILKLHTKDNELKRQAVQIIREETKSLEYTEAKVRELAENVHYLLRQLPGHNPVLEHMLAKLSLT